MSQNSKIGKRYSILRSIPDDMIRVEAAKRSGNSMTQLIKPSSKSLQRIDLANWKRAFVSAKNIENPNRVPLYEVYDNIMIDNTLTSIIDTRILKAQQAKFHILDKNNNPKDELTFLFEKPWFEQFIRYAMESRFEGFRLVEFFDFNEKGEVVSCNVVNKYHVKPELGIVVKEQADDKGISFIDGPNAVYCIAVGDKQDLGLLYKAAPHILAKKFAIGTWAEFNEKIGIPFRTVHTPINDKVRQQQLATIMETMGSAGWAVLNENEKVELLSITGTDPTKCFEGLINKMDAEIAMLILGQTMTSNSQNNKGTYGSMAILQQISNDRHEADLQFLKNTINNTLIPKMILWGYKGLNDVYFEWDKSVEMTIQETVDYVVKLSEQYEIPADFVTEKTGIPITGKRKQPTAQITASLKKKAR